MRTDLPYRPWQPCAHCGRHRVLTNNHCEKCGGYTRLPKVSDIPDDLIMDAQVKLCQGTDKRFACEQLAHLYPLKVVMAKMQQMANRGLLEVGVSLRCAWPADGRHRK